MLDSEQFKIQQVVSYYCNVLETLSLAAKANVMSSTAWLYVTKYPRHHKFWY